MPVYKWLFVFGTSIGYTKDITKGAPAVKFFAGVNNPHSPSGFGVTSRVLTKEMTLSYLELL